MDLQGTPYEDKVYFSIGEVSEILNIPASMIRFWENEFDVLKPQKNRKGDRRFSRTDLDNIRKLYSLLKVEGYTIEGAKKKLSQKSVVISHDEILAKLLEIKKRLISIKDKL